MRLKPSIPRLRRNSQTGFSLIELLVTIFVSGLLLTLMTGFFRANVGVRHDMDLQTNSQQGLRALFDMVTQELRQAGACLPRQGQFISLNGQDTGSLDSITLRIGRTSETTLRCIKAGTISDVTASNTLPFTAGDGALFADTDLVYVTPNGATGNFYHVTATTSSSVTLDQIGDFPTGTGVYAIDERMYQVEVINGRNVLTMQIDGGSSYPLVDGVQQFNVQYWLESTTDPSQVDPTPVDLPQDDVEWARVRRLTISAQVEEQKKRRDGQVVMEGGAIDVKPRNLL